MATKGPTWDIVDLTAEAADDVAGDFEALMAAAQRAQNAASRYLQRIEASGSSSRATLDYFDLSDPRSGPADCSPIWPSATSDNLGSWREGHGRDRDGSLYRTMTHNGDLSPSNPRRLQIDSGLGESLSETGSPEHESLPSTVEVSCVAATSPALDSGISTTARSLSEAFPLWQDSMGDAVPLTGNPTQPYEASSKHALQCQESVEDDAAFLLRYGISTSGRPIEIEECNLIDRGRTDRNEYVIGTHVYTPKPKEKIQHRKNIAGIVTSRAEEVVPFKHAHENIRTIVIESKAVDDKEKGYMNTAQRSSALLKEDRRNFQALSEPSEETRLSKARRATGSAGRHSLLSSIHMKRETKSNSRRTQSLLAGSRRKKHKPMEKTFGNSAPLPHKEHLMRLHGVFERVVYPVIKSARQDLREVLSEDRLTSIARVVANKVITKELEGFLREHSYHLDSRQRKLMRRFVKECFLQEALLDSNGHQSRKEIVAPDFAETASEISPLFECTKREDDHSNRDDVGTVRRPTRGPTLHTFSLPVSSGTIVQQNRSHRVSSCQGTASEQTVPGRTLDDFTIEIADPSDTASGDFRSSQLHQTAELQDIQECVSINEESNRNFAWSGDIKRQPRRSDLPKQDDSDLKSTRRLDPIKIGAIVNRAPKAQHKTLNVMFSPLPRTVAGAARSISVSQLSHTVMSNVDCQLFTQSIGGSTLRRNALKDSPNTEGRGGKYPPVITKSDSKRKNGTSSKPQDLSVPSKSRTSSKPQDRPAPRNIYHVVSSTSQEVPRVRRAEEDLTCLTSAGIETTSSRSHGDELQHSNAVPLLGNSSYTKVHAKRLHSGSNRSSYDLGSDSRSLSLKIQPPHQVSSSHQFRLGHSKPTYTDSNVANISADGKQSLIVAVKKNTGLGAERSRSATTSRQRKSSDMATAGLIKKPPPEVGDLVAIIAGSENKSIVPREGLLVLSDHARELHIAKMQIKDMQSYRLPKPQCLTRETTVIDPARKPRLSVLSLLRQPELGQRELGHTKIQDELKATMTEKCLTRETTVTDPARKPRLSVLSLLRQRELGQRELGHTKIQDELKATMTENMSPWRSWKGASGDIVTTAWAPNSTSYAAGAATHINLEDQMYNRSNNLLIGDLASNDLQELPDHRIPGYKHGDPMLYTTVADLQFSLDGHQLYTASHDATVKIWDVAQRKCIATLEHHEKVVSVEVHGHSTGVFATGSHTIDNAVRVYYPKQDHEISYAFTSFSSERAQAKPRSQIYPECLRWGPTSRNNHLLLAGFAQWHPNGRQGHLCLWDVNHGTPIQINPSSQSVYCTAWHPSMGLFATGGSPGSGLLTDRYTTKSVVRTWDIRYPLHYAMEYECTALDMNDITFNPVDASYVTAGCTDGSTYVWDFRMPDQFLHRLEHGHPLVDWNQAVRQEEDDAGVMMGLWDENGSRFYTGSSDGMIKAWDIQRAPEDVLVRNVAQLDAGVQSASFSPDFATLLVGDATGAINILSSAPYGSQSVGNGKNSSGSADPIHFVYAPDPEGTGGDEIGTEGIVEANALINNGALVRDTEWGIVRGPGYQQWHDKRKLKASSPASRHFVQPLSREEVESIDKLKPYNKVLIKGRQQTMAEDRRYERMIERRNGKNDELEDLTGAQVEARGALSPQSSSNERARHAPQDRGEHEGIPIEDNIITESEMLEEDYWWPRLGEEEFNELRRRGLMDNYGDMG